MSVEALDRRVVRLEIVMEQQQSQLQAMQAEAAAGRAEVRGLISDLTQKLALVLASMEREAGRIEGERAALGRFGWLKAFIPYAVAGLVYFGTLWVQDVGRGLP